MSVRARATPPTQARRNLRRASVPRSCASRCAQQRPAAPAGLSLYVHVPFCESPCFYCGCNRVITRDMAKGEHYTEGLLHEIRLIAPLLDPNREVIQLHLGGGTPNFLGAGYSDPPHRRAAKRVSPQQYCGAGLLHRT